MTAPIPEEEEQRPLGNRTPPGEHAGELPDADDAPGGSGTQEENAETSEDQPSQ
jgi:hypothetical protein